MPENTTYLIEHLDLIRLCKKNDQKAFEKVYRLYSKAMYNVCLRMLNNTQEAEDALQEGFISAFKKIDTYSENSSFASWLKRIMVNKCIDLIRKNDKNLLILDENQDFIEEDDEDEVHVSYSVESVHQALKKLPDGYRIILSLYLFEDYTHQQIADKLGISEGTSKSQYSRGKKKLVELIKNQAT